MLDTSQCEGVNCQGVRVWINYFFHIKSKIDTSQCKRVCEGVKVSLFSYKWCEMTKVWVGVVYGQTLI